MTDSRDKAALRHAYTSNIHGMQSAIQFLMDWAREHNAPEIISDLTPKHLRVGVNSAMLDSAALANVLIKKGVINEYDYLESLVNITERELERYTEECRRITGISNLNFG